VIASKGGRGYPDRFIRSIHSLDAAGDGPSLVNAFATHQPWKILLSPWCCNANGHPDV